MQGTVLFVATVYVLINVLVDVAYAYADPRIRVRLTHMTAGPGAARRLAPTARRASSAWSSSPRWRLMAAGARRGSARAIPIKTAPRDALQPPGARYLLGSDQFGRDVASRVLHGARISLTVGLIAVSIAVALGTPSASCPASTAGGSTRS